MTAILFLRYLLLITRKTILSPETHKYIKSLFNYEEKQEEMPIRFFGIHPLLLRESGCPSESL